MSIILQIKLLAIAFHSTLKKFYKSKLYFTVLMKYSHFKYIIPYILQLL